LAGSTQHGLAGQLASVKITQPQLKLLEFLAQRAGEVSWDWAKCRPDVAAMVADLINKQLVIEREYSTSALVSGRLFIRLTDSGRSIVSQLEAARGKITVVSA
jgi:hypothetical protein